ncbi:transcription elongation factor Spt6 [Flagelloscypha sp. PMI_526]|nr:transcription elongation factor Spt6 [Flagelloscypha sp. PMI_526]
MSVTICHGSPWLVFNHNRREKTPEPLLSAPTTMEVDNERASRHEEEENASEEGEGDDIQMNSDSSEEEPDDEMEAQRVRDGFIVDEATDSEEERREQRRKRRKKEKRRRRREKSDGEDDDDDDLGNHQLDEDDLELIGETPTGKQRRLYKRRDSSPQAKRRNVVESSDDDLDGPVLRAQDLDNIFQDTRDDEDDFMDDFIEDDDEEVPGMDEEAHKIQRRKATREAPPALEGLDATAWLEIHDVFGNGHEYDWALGDDDDQPMQELDVLPKEMRIQDVFEPSQIAARFLTEDDDIIRARDVPERLQLTTSTLSQNAALSDVPPLTEQDIGGATLWVIPRISAGIHRDFFSEDAPKKHLQTSLVTAVSAALRYLFIDQFEVPYVWTHKRDYLSHFDVTDVANQQDLLSCLCLNAGQALDQLFERLGVSDEYFEEEVTQHLDSVEIIADASEWLSMKYKAKKKNDFQITFDEEAEQAAAKRQKMPSRTSAYEIAKGTIVSRLGRCMAMAWHQHHIVQNFIGGHRLHFVDDQDLSPLIYAEGFIDSDPAKALKPEEVLRRARMILATELGRDPLLRNYIRKLFRDNAVVTVEPTDRGMGKILETHPFFVRCSLSPALLDGPQFLDILDAEEQHLVTVTISLPNADKEELEQKLNDAFVSDSFSEAARNWNEERARVIREVLDDFLIPAGTKWTREFLREGAGQLLRQRINVAPNGEVPTVLAVSWGMGDPLKDAIIIVFLDKDGHVREHTKIDNLVDDSTRDEFIDFFRRKKPDVIWDDQAPEIPVIYTHDDVARLYQHSPKADAEFSTLPTIAKYCVGLARYVQNPLIEFANLGIRYCCRDHLIPREKLLTALERALVDVANTVGVDINKAGGNLVNREQFVVAELMTTRIYLNAAGFLRIMPNEDFNVGDEGIQPDPLDESRIHPEDYEIARKMAADAMDLDEEDVQDQHPSKVVEDLRKDANPSARLAELSLDDFAINLFEQRNKSTRHALGVILEELIHPFAEKRPLPSPLAQWDILTMLSGETKETLEVGLIIPVMVTRVHAGGAVVRLDSGVEGTIAKDFLADVPPKRSEDAVSKGQTLDAIVFDLKFSGVDGIVVELSKRPQDLVGGDHDFRKKHKDMYWDADRYQKDLELLQRRKRAATDRSRRIIKHPHFHNFNSLQAENFLIDQQRGDLVIRPSSKGLNHLAITWKVDDGLFQHIDVTEPNADPTGQTVGNQLIVDSKHTYSDLDELIVNHVQAMSRRVEELMNHERFKSGPEEELHMFLKNVLAANPNKSMYGFTLNRKKPGHFNLCFLANKQSSVQTWPVRVAPEAYYLFEAAAAGVPELCDAFKVRHLHESQNASTANLGRTPFGAGGRTPARPGYGVTPGHMSQRQPAPPNRTPNPYGGATPRPPGWSGSTPAVPAAPPAGTSGWGGGQTPAAPSAGWGGSQTPSAGTWGATSGAPANGTSGWGAGGQTPRQPAAPSAPAGMNPQRAAMIQQQGGWGTQGGGWS